jgi:hypothetical protein
LNRTGLCLIAAAALFWLAWALMPGVGVTDAQRIFELVGSHRTDVLASVVVQLVSAVLYVPAMLGVAADERLGARPAGVLLVGALGSAADAVLHLLAFAMTAPGIDPAPMIPVMKFMQGPGLVLLAPLILGFFVGGAWLSIAAARAGVVPRWNPWLHAIALVTALAGRALASAGLVPPRIAGLTVLAIFAAAQIHVGLALLRQSKHPA